MKKRPDILSHIPIVVFFLGALLLSVFAVVNQPDTDLSRSKAQNIPTTPPSKTSLKETEGLLFDEIPDIPIYPAASIEESYVKRDGDLVGYEAEWKTPATATVVANWYTSALPAAGWTLTRVPESLATITPPGPLTDVEFMLVATKGNTQVNLIIENEHGGEETEIYAEFPLRKQ